VGRSDETSGGFGDKVASILDNAWPESRRYTAKLAKLDLGDNQLNVVADDDLDLTKPQDELFGGSWERDLLSALDELDNAAVTAAERKQLSKDPGAAEIRAQLAQGPTRDHKRGDPKGAISHFSAAIQANPEHPQPWTKRGIAHARLGKLEQAVDDYTEALDLDPNYLPALANRGSARFHLGDLEGTEQDCSAAVELEPKLAMAWLFRGIARAKLGNREGANEDLYYFLKLTPYSPYVELIRTTLKDRCNWEEDSDEGEVLPEE